MNSDLISILPSSQSMLGKTVREMIGADVQVRADGSVIGTFPYVEGYTGFDGTNAGNQEGHYFPFRLRQKSLDNKMTLIGPHTNKEIDYDPDIIFKVTDNSSKLTVKLDGVPYITLNFAGAKLLPKS